MVLEIVLLQNLDGVRHVNGYTDVFFELSRPCFRENDARLLVVCFAFAAAAVAAACLCRVQGKCFSAIVFCWRNHKRQLVKAVGYGRTKCSFRSGRGLKTVWPMLALLFGT